MLHLVAHSVPPGWLFHDWHEAAELWARLARLGPLRAVALMPDHVHYVTRAVVWAAWLAALNGYARWRNHRREELTGRKHVDRTLRYTHLNPCRDRLASDPLAWPFTTHRDAVGLAIPGLIAPDPRPERFHAYVSGDPSVHPDGTDLPFGLHGLRDPSVEQVADVVSALTRTVLDDLYRRGPARTLFIQALAACTPMSKRAIAAELGISHTTVVATAPIPASSLNKVERTLGDPRFPALQSWDLTGTRAWQGYRHARERKGVHALLVKNAAKQLRRRSVEKRPAHLLDLL